MLQGTAPGYDYRWCIHPYIGQPGVHHTLFCYQDLEQFIQPVMTFSRFSVEPIVLTFQVIIGSDIYMMYIPKRQSLIGHPLPPKVLE
ncbi:hypothetical protein T08_16432 [Trichinella sp. T8]|nr:hypothetical protein T08_16432 [Trichinella sp. T8]